MAWRSFLHVRLSPVGCAAVRLWQRSCGNATVEFALVLMPVLMVVCGGFEVAMLSYTRSQLEGATTRATRMATTGHYSDEDINGYIRERMATLNVAANDVIIKRSSYRSFTDINKPEPLVSDVEPIGGTPSSGDCYQDVNGNGQWDSDMGSDSLGRSEDVVRITVTVRYKLFFSFLGPLFKAKAGRLPIVSNVVMKSEPWGDRSSAEIPVVELCIA